jgi:hypothetical protein
VAHPRSAYALLVVLTATVYPSLEAMYADYRVTAAADMVRAGWASARAHALNESRAYRFAVVPNMGNFRIAPDSAEFWAGGDSTLADDGTGPALLVDGTLPSGVRFVPIDVLQQGGAIPGGDSALPVGGIDPGQWATRAVFLPDGTVQDDLELPLQARGARPVILNLRALTGVVNVRYFVPEGSRR